MTPGRCSMVARSPVGVPVARIFVEPGVNRGCATGVTWAGSDVRGSLGGGCGVEYPTEDEVSAMSNREFASLMRSQAETIDRSLHRGDGPFPEAQTLPLKL